MYNVHYVEVTILIGAATVYFHQRKKYSLAHRTLILVPRIQYIPHSCVFLLTGAETEGEQNRHNDHNNSRNPKGWAAYFFFLREMSNNISCQLWCIIIASLQKYLHNLELEFTIAYSKSIRCNSISLFNETLLLCINITS